MIYLQCLIILVVQVMVIILPMVTIGVQVNGFIMMILLFKNLQGVELFQKMLIIYFTEDEDILT